MSNIESRLEKIAESRDIINMAQGDIREAEIEIKEEIISDRNYDLLKVDYTKLARVYGIGPVGKGRIK